MVVMDIFLAFYVAMTKHIPVNKEELGLHVSYLYNRRNDYHLNGIAGGITYSPSMLSDLKLIAEYDSHDILIGMNYLLFHHFFCTSNDAEREIFLLRTYIFDSFKIIRYSGS